MADIRSPNQRSNAEFLQDFERKTVAARTPLDVSFGLTHRCNLRCVHCYLGDQAAIHLHRNEELSTAEVTAILDQLAQAGALNLTLTGGDPMIRGDFMEVYTHAVRLGFLITVFCDGVLINDEIVALFRRYPPRTVEITVYGATPETYERITQVRGSHARFREGVERLKGNGIRFRLKTVLMTLNAHELADMEDMARDYGARFHHDSAIFPCLPGPDNRSRSNQNKPVTAEPEGGNADVRHIRDAGASRSPPATNPTGLQAPLRLRISPDQALKADIGSDKRLRQWVDFYRNDERKNRKPRANRLYVCGAGLNTCHIDPYGMLQPCVITTRVRYDLRKGSFQEGWDDVIADIREVRPWPGYICNECELLSTCVGCPAVFDPENGMANTDTGFYCEVTHNRDLAIRLAIHDLDTAT